MSLKLTSLITIYGRITKVQRSGNPVIEYVVRPMHLDLPWIVYFENDPTKTWMDGEAWWNCQTDEFRQEFDWIVSEVDWGDKLDGWQDDIEEDTLRFLYETCCVVPK